jgi:hypothetical protein
MRRAPCDLFEPALTCTAQRPSCAASSRRQLRLYCAGARLVNLPRTHGPRGRLREYLQARCQARELFKYGKSHEHPKLIRVRNSILCTPRREMLRNQGANIIRLGSTRCSKTADARPVESHLCFSPNKLWTSGSAGCIDSDPHWIESQTIANCRDVCRCFASETLNGSPVQRCGIASPPRWRQVETAERLWDEVILFPCTHNDRKVLFLRDCQIDSDETTSHVVLGCLTCGTGDEGDVAGLAATSFQEEVSLARAQTAWQPVLLPVRMTSAVDAVCQLLRVAH